MCVVGKWDMGFKLTLFPRSDELEIQIFLLGFPGPINGVVHTNRPLNFISEKICSKSCVDRKKFYFKKSGGKEGGELVDFIGP